MAVPYNTENIKAFYDAVKSWAKRLSPYDHIRIDLRNGKDKKNAMLKKHPLFSILKLSTQIIIISNMLVGKDGYGRIKVAYKLTLKPETQTATINFNKPLALKISANYLKKDKPQIVTEKDIPAGCSLKPPRVARSYLRKHYGDDYGENELQSLSPKLALANDYKFYYTMPLFPCVTLHTYFRKHEKSLTQKQRYQLAIAITQAVDALHKQGYIHGDLKPTNMLVDDKGDSYIVYLIDHDFVAQIGTKTIKFPTPGYQHPLLKQLIEEKVASYSAEVRYDMYSLKKMIIDLFGGFAINSVEWVRLSANYTCEQLITYLQHKVEMAAGEPKQPLPASGLSSIHNDFEEISFSYYLAKAHH